MVKKAAITASVAVPPAESTSRATTAACGSSAATPPMKPSTAPISPTGGRLSHAPSSIVIANPKTIH